MTRLAYYGVPLECDHHVRLEAPKITQDAPLAGNVPDAMRYRHECAVTIWIPGGAPLAWF